MRKLKAYSCYAHDLKATQSGAGREVMTLMVSGARKRILVIESWRDRIRRPQLKITGQNFRLEVTVQARFVRRSSARGEEKPGC